MQGDHHAPSVVLCLTNIGRYWSCEIEKVMNASYFILSRQVLCTYLKAKNPKGQCYHLYYFLSNEIFQICGKATSHIANEIPAFAASVNLPYSSCNFCHSVFSQLSLMCLNLNTEMLPFLKGKNSASTKLLRQSGPE